MTSTFIDRLNAVVDAQAFKAPCRVATTANITLSGLQTIDGVTVADGDRVLVKNQTDNTTNGIYTASTGNWVRSYDMDSNVDGMVGTLVAITAGTTNSGLTFWVTAWPTNIGSNAMTFASLTLPAVLARSNNLSDLTSPSTARTNLGLTSVATMSVGTTTGTVAAGDDGRFPLTPEMYGAAGDGTTNDTTAIVNWLTGTRGKFAQGTPGKTYLTDPVVISQTNNNVPQAIDFRGATIKSRASSSSPLLTIENPHAYVTNFEIRNLSLNANSLHANALYVHGWQHGCLRNIIVTGATAGGVVMTGEPGYGIYYCLFENILSQNSAAADGFRISSINNASGYYFASNSFLNCRSIANAAMGWRLDYATGIWVGCEAETNGTAGFGINNSVDVAFIGCYNELNPSSGDISYYAIGGTAKGVRVIGGRTIGAISSALKTETSNFIHTSDVSGNLIYYSRGVDLSSMTKGAADSGGTGFSVLRVPN